MLRSLSISNYALIDNLEIEFPDGLVIITGETGAGKSILLGALSLLLGAKSDLSVLRDNNRSCIVEGEFFIEDRGSIQELFESEGIDIDENITLRRVISNSGKSRSFVNDMPVSVAFLKSLSEKIIDVHAQHEHLLLGDNNFQMAVLDSFAGNADVLERYRYLFFRLRELESIGAELKQKLAKEESERDYNIFLLNQLEEAKLIDGEQEELEQELDILNNAGEIKDSLFTSLTLLSSDELSVSSRLKEATIILNKIGRHFAKANELCDRIESCRYELRDIEEVLSREASNIEVSPERASVVEERLSSIYALQKRHNVNSIKELIDIKESLEKEANNLVDLEDKIAANTKETDECREERDSVAAKLEASRMDAIPSFVKEIESKIRDLEMPHASFEVALQTTDKYTINGNNDILYKFSANKNMAMRDLSKTASGGELSRIMLCLKAVMAKNSGMPSLIFDEIDTGVSGSIADKMGNLIDELASNMQVFAITHLPQIASKGSAHLLVFKEFKNNITTTGIRRIDGDERVAELARMLSGSVVSQAAIANARELLKS